MYFKFYLLILIMLSILSCGLKVGEPVPENDIVDLKNTKCLNQSISTLKIFIDGKANDNEVDDSFRCISQVLLAFKNNINGADRDFFAPEELAYFIETNFLKGEYSFKSEFLSEIMKLKFVLIGGSAKVFYKKDIEQLSMMIDRLRPEIVKLNTDMKIISGDWLYSDISETDKEKMFIAAKKNAARFFEILSGEFAMTGNKYEADHFLNLIKQMAFFANSDSATIDKIEKSRPFLINFKKSLVGQGTQISARDWSKITKTLNEMLFQLLRIKYFLKPLAQDQSEKHWLVYEKISEDLFHLIATLLETQKNPVLSNQQIYDLISSVLPIFSEQTIDQDLVQSISELKNALIGKKVLNPNNWSASDLNQIKLKLPILFSEIRKILNSAKQLNLQTSKWKQSYTDFNALEIEFNQSIAIFMNQFDGGYSLDSLEKLVESLNRNKLLNGYKLPDNLDKLFIAAKSAKQAMTGTPGSVLSNSEFRHVVAVAASGYFHYLEFSNYMNPFKMLDRNFYTGFENILPKIKMTIQKSIDFKTSRMFSTTELTDLFEVLKTTNLIQTKISTEGFKSILDTLWSNILIEPKHRLSGAVLPGFNSEALTQLTSETSLFIQSGYDLFDIFQKDIFLSQKIILFRINGLINLPSTPPLQMITLGELNRVVNSPLPMVLDQNKFLKILELNMNYQPNDLLQVQISRALSRVLISSFSKDFVRIKKMSGITLPEAEQFFTLIKKVFIDLGMISPSNTSFVASRFREANLFVAHANGDDLANFEELSDLVIHIFSGLSRADVLREGAVKSCLPPQNDPVTGQTAISEVCLLQYYLNTTAGFDSIPKFLELKKQYTADQNKNYYLSLLKAVGHIQNERQVVLFDDANLFPHVAQYIEVMFSRYDKNQDGFLVKDEALKAFPVFKSTIKDVLGQISGGSLIGEDQLPGVFIYLLKFGRPPKTPMEKLNFIGFVRNESKWIIESNRLDLGVIFNFIADSLAKP